MHLGAQKRRAHIHQLFEHIDVSQMNDAQLEELFWLYDKIFFNSQIKEYFNTHSDEILTVKFDQFGHAGQKRNFGENGEIIDTKGISGHSLMETYEQPQTYRVIHRIFISRPIFNELFTNGATKECSNGLVCRDRLSCLQLTLEHEITHLIIDLFYPALQNGHGKDFKKMVYNLFGQTNTIHTLGNQCQ